MQGALRRAGRGSGRFLVVPAAYRGADGGTHFEEGRAEGQVTMPAVQSSQSATLKTLYPEPKILYYIILYYLYVLPSTPCTLHPKLYTQHTTLYSLHPTLYILHPESCTQHLSLYTLHPTLYTLHPTPSYPKPEALEPTTPTPHIPSSDT
jgi:hypothetical protein